MANVTLSFQKRNQTQAIFAAALAVICFAPLNSVVYAAQSDARLDNNVGLKSILVFAGDENPAKTSSGANGSASIESINPQRTFTRQEFSRAPEPPTELIVPSDMNSNFTRPLVNALRTESVSAGGNSTQTKLGVRGNQNDGSEAVGTFATTNQNFQDPPLQGQSPRAQSPSLSGSGFQPPSSLRRFESPPSPAQAAARPPMLSTNFGAGSNSNSNTTNSNQLGVWRDVAPQTNQQPNVKSYNINSESNGQSSRSNSMQPLRSFQGQPNTAPPIRSSFNAQPTERFAAQSSQGNLRDDLVRPTSFTQPMPRKKRSTDLAKSLMARYAVDKFNGALPGQPVKMLEMLRQPISTEQRRPMVNQFWLTYYDWANMVSDQQFEQWLNQIPAVGSAADRAMIDAAKAVAKNKTLSAEIQLGKSQSQLMQYMPNRQSNLLPLPNDLPLIQNYRTNYEAYKSQQMLPVSLLGIDEMLPKTLELIKQRAAAVRVAKSAADTVISALSARQATIATVLEAGDVWRNAEQDLIASVVDYNQAIGDYSLSIPHGYQAPEQVVNMLIAKPKAASVTQAPQGQNGFRNSQAQGSRFNSGQSQAEARRQTAAQQQNAFSRNGQNFGNGSQSGGPPQGRTAQANSFLNQAQRESDGQRLTGKNQQRPQGNNALGFNLGSGQFGGGIRGEANNSNPANRNVAPITKMGTGNQPAGDPFADSQNKRGQSTQSRWGQ